MLSSVVIKTQDLPTQDCVGLVLDLYMNGYAIQYKAGTKGKGKARTKARAMWGNGKGGARTKGRGKARTKLVKARTKGKKE